jgi:lipopolysaccharide export system protein LptC
VIRVIRMALERLSLYLPIILMGFLALGTYWLVRSTPMFTPPQADQAQRHEHDYSLQKFSVKNFDATGRLKTEMFGFEARHYPDTDTLEIEQFRIHNFNEKGHAIIATSNRAVINSDATEVQLIGDAVVVREAIVGKPGEAAPRMSFRGEFLHAYIETERVKSHKPVELTRGNDHFTADSLDYDNFDQVLKLEGRVHGTLVQNQPGQKR